MTYKSVFFSLFIKNLHLNYFCSIYDLPHVFQIVKLKLCKLGEVFAQRVILVFQCTQNDLQGSSYVYRLLKVWKKMIKLQLDINSLEYQPATMIEIDHYSKDDLQYPAAIH